MSESRGITRREALRITAVSGVSLALGGGLVHGLMRRARLQRITETHARLGTLVTITSVHPDRDEARAIVEAGFAEIERLEAILNRHASGTVMSTLNLRGRLDDPPAELLEVLRRARTWYERSGGAFDPTVGPLLDLYADRARRGLPLPAEGEIERALEGIGFEHVQFDDGAVRFTRSGIALTLDGIAKGYVVDRTVARVVGAGAERVMIDAGGDMASGGPTVTGEPWTIGLQDPHEPGGSLGRIRLAGDAVATSGDYMQSFTEDRRHHHILDPRTGRSPEHTSAVTVLTATAMDADALSTAAFVLGPEAAIDLLDRTDGVEGMVVGKDGRRWLSRGMAGRAV